MRLTRIVSIGAVLLSLSGAVDGQRGNAVPANKPFPALPALFHQQVTKLGERIRVSGNEKTVYTGEVVDAAGKKSPALVIYQTPGLVRLVGFRAGPALSFDGERSIGVTSYSDELLLETFVMDLPEGMLASVLHSAAVRLLGSGLGPDPRKTPDYAGPRYDVFEVTGPVRARTDDLIRRRLYYFDSSTGLLLKTDWNDETNAASTQMETRFLNWQTVSGSAYPGRIDHFEAGRLIFSFTVLNIAGGPAVDTGQFR